MSYSAQELFGDFSDNDGFSEDENLSIEGKKIFKKMSSFRSKATNDGNFQANRAKSNAGTWKSKNVNVLQTSYQNDEIVNEIYSGIRLVNPLVSSEQLRILMQGRKMIKLSLLKSHINKKTNDVDDDWVTMGVVVSKATKQSKNGNEYSLWKLSDLKSDKLATLFLFGKSNDKHWKLPLGAVIGLLNASLMSDSKEYKSKKTSSQVDICSMTIDDPDKLLHIGSSKDMGYCKALKKNGETCGNLITKAEDEFCLYHIKNAYRKYSSKRAEIQTSFSNKEPEDFHFSNNFTPNLALNQRNIVLEMKSINNTQMINKKQTENKNLQKVIANPVSLAAQHLAVLSTSNVKRTDNVTSSTFGIARTSAPISFKDILGKVKSNSEKNTKSTTEEKSPALAKGLKRGQSIELHVTGTQVSAAKRRAIEILKNKPVTGNSKQQVTTGLTSSGSAVKNKKLQNILDRVNRNLNESNQELIEQQQMETKKKNNQLIEEALKRRSVNEKVIGAIEMEAEERHFDQLEKKERLTTRLEELKELPVKVVTCAVCKYTAISQGELCKSRHHQITVHQATKRFFACKACKSRTYTFDSIMPSKPCACCGGTNYERTAMAKEKTETKLCKDLLIRGEEMKFLNSLK